MARGAVADDLSECALFGRDPAPSRDAGSLGGDQSLAYGAGIMVVPHRRLPGRRRADTRAAVADPVAGVLSAADSRSARQLLRAARDHRTGMVCLAL